MAILRTGIVLEAILENLKPQIGDYGCRHWSGGSKGSEKGECAADAEDSLRYLHRPTIRYLKRFIKTPKISSLPLLQSMGFEDWG